MKIIILAVGTKMPKWVKDGFYEYQKRFPAYMSLQLKEIEPVKRQHGSDEEKAKMLEGRLILENLPKKAYIIALDERGVQFDSISLSRKIGDLQSGGMDVVLIIGGPNGLTDEVRARAHELWSLSRLTLPHPLVRIFVAETLYRALSIYQNLPYHRA
jgi:23S rRNA (pseudouridine1915-N3)-methyltransferase